MHSAVVSRLRRLLHSDEAWYGLEYALLSAAIACLLVLTASVFGAATTRLIQDLRCELSPGCRVQLERAQRPSAPEPNAVHQIVVFPLPEKEEP